MRIASFLHRFLTSLVIICLCLFVGASTAQAAGVTGVVTGATVNVRSYAAISPTNRLFQVTSGLEIDIHGTYGDFFVATILGYRNVFISQEWVRISQAVGVTTNEAAIFDRPMCREGVPIGWIPLGSIVDVHAVYNDWLQISHNGTKVFAHESHIFLPDFVTLPPVRIPRVGMTLADEVIEMAKQYLGAPYLFGGSSPAGFDCSGFVSYVFRTFDISLHRRSQDMALFDGTPVVGLLMPADLLFFSAGGGRITHVALYIGDGRFIHSSQPHSGGVIISRLDCDHSRRTFQFARRVLP